jgi:hypothetical protein
MTFIIDERINHEDFNGRIIWRFKLPDSPKQTCKLKGKIKKAIIETEKNGIYDLKEISFRTYECDSQYICVPTEFIGKIINNNTIIGNYTGKRVHDTHEIDITWGIKKIKKGTFLVQTI